MLSTEYDALYRNFWNEIFEVVDYCSYALTWKERFETKDSRASLKDMLVL